MNPGRDGAVCVVLCVSAGMPSAMLSAVLEEEPDLYEAFPPHVDPSGITILTDSPPGEC